MDPIFHPAMEAAKSGDLVAFARLLDDNPELLSARSSVSHPSLAQFVVVDGGLGNIPEPLACLDILLEHGASPDSIVVPAASVNARALVDALMTAGADIEAGAPWTPLEEALYWGHQSLGGHLIERYSAQIPSLRAAAQLGRVDLLQEHFGSDGRLKPSAGKVVYPFGEVCAEDVAVLNQALFLALRSRQLEAADALLGRGANLNTIVMGHHEHCAPLHQAVYLESEDLVRWLLDRGARTDIVDPRFNATPIQWAHHFGHDGLANILEE